jgi:retron-type reverse transcriptase
MQRELRSGTYTLGSYRHFHIQDPKPRKISAAPFRDRVVHHAVVNVLEPIYERRFIYDSYACRKGKGTHRALDRAQLFVRSFRYCLKTDIVRFFPNIDHAVLLKLLERTIRDRDLMDLVRLILRSGEDVLRDQAIPGYFPGDDLFAVLRPRGLPIGNLTSQFFANVLLDPVDHYIKESMGVRGYVRYADDLLLFSNSKSELWQWRDMLRDRLGAYRLRIHKNKTQIVRSDRGVRFLGFVIRPAGRRLQQQGIRRFGRLLRRLQWEYRHGLIGAEQIRGSLRAWQAHVSTGNTAGIQKAVWKKVVFRRP